MELLEKESLELSIVMPCLNEEGTVGLCVEEALGYLRCSGLRGEVLVVDNGSTDGSAAVAKMAGARVVRQPVRGYGNALRCGIANSRGSAIILGDCDTTYDFSHLDEMVRLLRLAPMVIGDRYAGGMEPGSMPLSHRWGVKFLSWCGRMRYHTDVRDFHCGLRGLTRQAAEQLEFSAGGMEFATEMIARAAGQHLTILQTPTPLRCCACPRRSKLRTIPDGLRHLRYILRG